MENEIWKDVVCAKLFASVSNLGNLKTQDRMGLKKMCKSRGIKSRITHNGYLRASINIKKGTYKTKMAHRLVAIAFIPNPKNKPFINHINGIKTDNRVENLEWCTALENARHAVDMGLTKRGEDKINSKLKESQVRIIKHSKERHCDLALQYNVSSTAIIRIRQGYLWKHVN